MVSQVQASLTPNITTSNGPGSNGTFAFGFGPEQTAEIQKYHIILDAVLLCIDLEYLIADSNLSYMRKVAMAFNLSRSYAVLGDTRGRRS